MIIGRKFAMNFLLGKSVVAVWMSGEPSTKNGMRTPMALDSTVTFESASKQNQLGKLFGKWQSSF